MGPCIKFAIKINGFGWHFREMLLVALISVLKHLPTELSQVIRPFLMRNF